jgi:hypothetical protein
MSAKPVLDNWEIPRISALQTWQRRELVELAVPGRVGSIFQDLDSEPTRIVIAGSLHREEERDEFLDEVRKKHQAGEPVSFTADLLRATELQYVVIESLLLGQSAELPDQIDFEIVLRESPPPPPPPDPLGGLEDGLLAGAAGLLDSVTGALDALDALGNVPNISDPTPPLRDALAGVAGALEGLGTVTSDLAALFGTGGA